MEPPVRHVKSYLQLWLALRLGKVRLAYGIKHVKIYKKSNKSYVNGDVSNRKILLDTADLQYTFRLREVP